MRILGRETAFKLVYSFLFTKKEDFSLEKEVLTDSELKLSKEAMEFSDRIYKGVIEKYDELSEEISKKAVGFKEDRIYLIDKAILLVAMYEIKYMDDVPVKVSANEAVELAKKYSTEKSPSYINGILANVIKEL